MCLILDWARECVDSFHCRGLLSHGTALVVAGAALPLIHSRISVRSVNYLVQAALSGAPLRRLLLRTGRARKHLRGQEDWGNLLSHLPGGFRSHRRHDSRRPPPLALSPMTGRGTRGYSLKGQLVPLTPTPPTAPVHGEYKHTAV